METVTKLTNTYNDIYQEVTETVIKALEEGTVIWQCSWNATGLPKNFLTSTYYRAWNIFILNFHTFKHQFPTTDYLTYNQANKLGGTIREDEKGVKIIYWATIELKKEKGKATIMNAKNPDDTNPVKLVPKAYTVFNIAETEGIKYSNDNSIILSDLEMIDNCERLIKEMPMPPKSNLQENLLTIKLHLI